MQGRRHEVGTQRTSASRRLQRRLHLRVAAGTGGRRLGACGAGSACESRPTRAAGAWAPAARAPLASRGLQKKRQSRADGQVCPSARLLMVREPASSPYETSTNRRTAGLGRCRTCGRPRTVGTLDLRRLVQVSCGWPRVGRLRDPQAPGVARAARCPRGPAAGAGRNGRRTREPRRRRPSCTFFEVRCSLVDKIAVRAHFLRFVAASSTKSPFVHIFCSSLQLRAAPLALTAKAISQNRRSEKRWCLQSSFG